MSNKKIKIYILHYQCGLGDGDVKFTCRSKACDLCDEHNPLYYVEREVDKDELFDCVNLYAHEYGNYVHISTVKPEGWMSKDEYDGL